MSSDDGESVAQEVLDSLSRLLVENYCIVASSVLLFVDWGMTFTDEVQRIWGRRFTGATAVFLLTRYVAVAERIVLVTSVFLPTLEDKRCACVLAKFQTHWSIRWKSSCVPVLRLDDTLTDISYLMFGVFMMLRMRGIWGRGWTPIVFLALLTPVRTVITLYTQVNYIPIAFGAPLYGCGAVFKLSDDSIKAAAALAIDTTVLVFTWVRTFSMKRESYRLGLETPLVTLLLRDGTIYFVIILFVQVFSIVSDSAGSASDYILWDVWPYFDQVFTVIFSCRFMLNLRGIYLTNHATETTFTNGDDHFARTGDMSTLHFSSVVGNMGAPLETFSPRDTSFAGSRGCTTDDGTLEMSSDPLFAGLQHSNHVELEEMPYTTYG
ncbi:hypothetical protein C8Q79DRAFT_1014296 [Trametes meyenii]|nr:hypothetical protein C8Q79DRAFT_1014296 [Trametes meyenii]